MRRLQLGEHLLMFTGGFSIVRSREITDCQAARNNGILLGYFVWPHGPVLGLHNRA